MPLADTNKWLASQAKEKAPFDDPSCLFKFDIRTGTDHISIPCNWNRMVDRWMEHLSFLFFFILERINIFTWTYITQKIIKARSSVPSQTRT